MMLEMLLEELMQSSSGQGSLPGQGSGCPFGVNSGGSGQ